MLKRRNAVFGFVVHMDPQALAMCLKLCRDIAMTLGVPPGWKILEVNRALLDPAR